MLNPQNDPSEIWQKACRLLEQNIVPNQIKTWIRPLAWVKSEQIEEGFYRVVLASPNDFSASWVKDHYLQLIESSISEVFNSKCKVELVTQSQQPGINSLIDSPLRSSEGRSEDLIGELTKSVVLKTKSSQVEEYSFDPKYSFPSFVVGASNQFAYASAVAVAEKPATQYNPLFIYSSPGLGKTHLLQAIGSHFKSKFPNKKVGYISAETFVNQLIESIQHHKVQEFRTRYRESYDLLMIDDIQFIAEKHKTEEEFFHTFNALYGAKKQIVVTSDRPPKEIEGLEERIRTRFEWGLVVDIQPPEIETRIAILKTKAERDDIYLPDEAATFIATHVKSNVRELEGLLIRLQAQSSLTGAEISLDMAKQELKTALPEEGSVITVENIQTVVSKFFQIKPQDLKSTTRVKTIAFPRQIAMYLVRKYTGLGLKDIGQFFGGKDHTTILHACQKIEKNIENDDSIRTVIENIQNQL